MTSAKNAAKRSTTKVTARPRLITKPSPLRLRLSPYAWAKLVHLRDAGETEIGGFGISSSEDLLLVEDVVLLSQRCDWASVAFDDGAVADLFDGQVDLGRRPEEFGRIWVHTHPGESPQPSFTDEETFARVFGGCAWAVMFILARGGVAYARLRFGVGPGGEVVVPVDVDYSASFPGTDRATWQAEYEACVQAAPDPWPGWDVRSSSSLEWDEADMLRP